ncbi:hypothetical protein AAZX31_19G098600 [Glycine max]
MFPDFLCFMASDKKVPSVFNFIGTKDAFRGTLNTFLLQTLAGWHTASLESPNKMLDPWRNLELPNVKPTSSNLEIACVKNFFHDTIISASNSVCSIVAITPNKTINLIRKQ